MIYFRNLARTTLIGHLCEALKLGLPVDLPRAGVIDEVQEMIIKVIRSPPINSSKSLFSSEPVFEQYRY